MKKRRKLGRGVAIVGAGMSKFGMFKDKDSKDLFAEAGIEPPTTTRQLLKAAEIFHDPRRDRYGIAWNAARGTALGHTVLMTMADFGQPIIDLPRITLFASASLSTTSRSRSCVSCSRS